MPKRLDQEIKVVSLCGHVCWSKVAAELTLRDETLFRGCRIGGGGGAGAYALLVLVLVVEFRISRCTPQKLLGVAIVARVASLEHLSYRT